jgi:hypothetical protein
MTGRALTGESVVVEQQSSTLTRPGRGIAVVGFFFAASALWIYPILCGAIGAACGAYAMARRDRLGRTLLIVSIACLVAGYFFQKLPEPFFS